MPVWLIPMAYTLISLVAAIVVRRIEHGFALPVELGISPFLSVAPHDRPGEDLRESGWPPGAPFSQVEARSAHFGQKFRRLSA